MDQANSVRFPKWLLLILTVLGGSGAAFCFIVYVANGMVIGDLIGLFGREHDIAVAQHRSSFALLSCVLLQFGVAGAVFSCMDRDNGRVWRILGAPTVSLVVTVACGAAMVFGFRALR